MTCQPQSGSAFERIQQSRWILSGSLASSTMPSQRQRCCTFSKNLNSFASLAKIFQLCSYPLDSASTNSENDKNHGLGARAGQFRRNSTISVLPSSLAISSGVSPRLQANLSPKIRIEWGSVTSSSTWLSTYVSGHSPNGTSCMSNLENRFTFVFRQHPLDQARINLLGNNISWTKVGVKPAIWPNISCKSNPFWKKLHLSILFII